MEGVSEAAAVEAEGAGQLRLSILGGFRLIDAHGAEVAGLHRHERALLAYLCLTSLQRHGRKDLASLLWPDRFDKQARASLRECLHGLIGIAGFADPPIRALPIDYCDQHRPQPEHDGIGDDDAVGIIHHKNPLRPRLYDGPRL
jgi:hypothetical protein